MRVLRTNDARNSKLFTGIGPFTFILAPGTPWSHSRSHKRIPVAGKANLNDCLLNWFCWFGRWMCKKIVSPVPNSRRQLLNDSQRGNWLHLIDWLDSFVKSNFVIRRELMSSSPCHQAGGRVPRVEIPPHLIDWLDFFVARTDVLYSPCQAGGRVPRVAALLRHDPRLDCPARRHHQRVPLHDWL